MRFRVKQQMLFRKWPTPWKRLDLQLSNILKDQVDVSNKKLALSHIDDTRKVERHVFQLQHNKHKANKHDFDMVGKKLKQLALL